MTPAVEQFHRADSDFVVHGCVNPDLVERVLARPDSRAQGRRAVDLRIPSRIAIDHVLPQNKNPRRGGRGVGLAYTRSTIQHGSDRTRHAVACRPDASGRKTWSRYGDGEGAVFQLADFANCHDPVGVAGNVVGGAAPSASKIAQLNDSS